MTSSLSQLLEHNQTHHSVGFFWTGDQPDKENSSWHKTRSENTDKIFRRHSRSQQTIGRRPTPCDRATTGIGTIDSEANMNNGGGRKIMYSSTGLRDTFFFSRGQKSTFLFHGPRSSKEPSLINTAITDPENIYKTASNNTPHFFFSSMNFKHNGNIRENAFNLEV